jgi:flagellar biogenesis protein FliO
LNKIYRVNRIMMVITGLLLIPEITYAANKEEAGPEMFSGGGQWFFALLSLVFVVFLAYWATRFLAGKYGNLPSRHMKVAESLCLGPNRHLYLLLVNDQVLLVGSTEHGIQLMKEYSDPAFYEEMRRLSPQSRVSPAGKFQEMLASLMGKNDTEADMTAGRMPELKNRLSETLAKLRSGKTKD